MVFISDVIQTSNSAVLSASQGGVELLRSANGEVTPLETNANTGCTVRFKSTTTTQINISAIVTLFGRRI